MSCVVWCSVIASLLKTLLNNRLFFNGLFMKIDITMGFEQKICSVGYVLIIDSVHFFLIRLGETWFNSRLLLRKLFSQARPGVDG